MRQPIDDLFSILLLLLRVLALRRNSLAGSKSANVYAYAYITSPRKICVLRIVSCRSSIKRVAVEIWGIFDEVETHSALRSPAHDRRKAVLVIKRDSNAANDGHRISELGLAIAWQVDADLMTQSRQSPRQRTHHVGQAASL